MSRCHKVRPIAKQVPRLIRAILPSGVLPLGGRSQFYGYDLLCEFSHDETCWLHSIEQRSDFEFQSVSHCKSLELIHWKRVTARYYWVTIELVTIQLVPLTH